MHVLIKEAKLKCIKKMTYLQRVIFNMTSVFDKALKC